MRSQKTVHTHLTRRRPASVWCPCACCFPCPYSNSSAGTKWTLIVLQVSKSNQRGRKFFFTFSTGVKVTGPPRGKTKITIDGGAVEKGRSEIHSEAQRRGRAFAAMFCLLSVLCSCLRPLAERPPVVVALLLQLGPLPEYEGGQRTVVEWRSPEYLTKLGSGYLPQRKSLMGGILLNSV